ncbi:MAG TPA: hypothetical protein PKD67_03750 [Ignavibacteriaceae bacterium]|jgi:predicted RNA-binding Zn-ribbon protein involved in translation (DUF1610 family)|nr:hypothetical protein [Ignavibacteriaceae bacterium]
MLPRNLKKIIASNINYKGKDFSLDFLKYANYITATKKSEMVIDTSDTIKWHFAKCNNIKCNSIFLVDPEETVGELGFICPDCSRKTHTSHIVQCASCKTILNFVRAAPNEEKVIFTVPKCSHCIGTIEDEWEIEPLYQPDSYI